MSINTSRLARRFHALDSRLRPAFALALRQFFAGQADRVLTRYLALYFAVELVAPQPHPEELLPDQERQLLLLAMVPFLYAALTESGNLAGALVGLDAMAEADPRIGELLSETAPRAAWMHRTTLDAIRAALAEGVSRGYTVGQIAHGVPEDSFLGVYAVVAETYRGRSETIARTELARATNLAALERYQEGGASEVYVIDGMANPTPCGWLYHDDEDVANDTWRTVIDARQHPIAHPNCHRRFLPPMPGRNRVPQLPRPQRLHITVDIERGPR